MYRTRDFRIDNRTRIRSKTKRIAKMYLNPNEEVVISHWVNKNSNNRKPCSCHFCGNRRKYGKGVEQYTIQERRHMVKCNCEEQFYDEDEYDRN